MIKSSFFYLISVEITMR